MHTSANKKNKAFTLIELLTVIAIIGILAGIIIPTVSGVRNSAKKASTRAQFSQLISAMTLFKQEYGYYPQFGESSGQKKFTDAADTRLLVGTLSGKKLDGTSATTAEAGENRRKIAFYAFSDKDINANGLFQDAFENIEIAVVVDKTGTGVITQSAGSVKSAATERNFTPSTGSGTSDIPSSGVRAGVIIYSAGNGNGTGNTVSSANAVMSWK